MTDYVVLTRFAAACCYIIASSCARSRESTQLAYPVLRPWPCSIRPATPRPPARFALKLACDSPMDAEDSREVAEDPGLIILYDCGAVHTALGQPNTPIQQANDPPTSLQNFKRYVYQMVMTTPCSEDDHALERPASVGSTRREFYPELFHRLPADTYRKIITHLKDTFIYSGFTVRKCVLPCQHPKQPPTEQAPGGLVWRGSMIMCSTYWWARNQ